MFESQPELEALKTVYRSLNSFKQKIEQVQDLEKKHFLLKAHEETEESLKRLKNYFYTALID